MERTLRTVILGVGVASLLLAAGFTLRIPWATRLWPFAMLETRLGFIFLGAIAAAVAAPTFWIALTGRVRAAEAGALNLTVIFWGWTVFAAALAFGAGKTGLVLPAALYAALGASAVVAFGRARRVPWPDPRPTPGLVRTSFAVFFLALMVTSTALLAGYPTVFPWPLARESSVMYGIIFLGAATYFAHGYLRPVWANATGQLLGFLAYDLVLIPPFLRHFATVQPAHQLSLVIYMIVLVSSGLLAVYYLFVNPATRLGSAAGRGSTPPPR